MEFRFTWHNTQAGAPVWAPLGEHGWRAALINSLGRKYVRLQFCDRKGQPLRSFGRRAYDQLRRRDPLARGKDKPRPLAELAILGATSDPAED